MTAQRAAASSLNVNERELLVAFADELGEAGLFVDVGAHVGSYSAAFAERGWDVVAIEAAPDIHAELVERMAAHDRVEVIHAAVNDTGGDPVEFFISSEYWGIHSLRPFHETHDTSVMVPTVRVADVLDGRQHTGPLILKVDTEGADLIVLRGVDWEAERPRIVVCEFMDERTLPHFGYRYTDMVRFMEERGYVTYVSEWAPVDEPARRGKGGGPFTHLQVVRGPLHHEPAWGNLFFLPAADAGLFEEVLTRYLTDIRRRGDEMVAAALKSANRLEHLEQSIINREGSIERLKARVASLGERSQAERDRLKARVAELDAAVKARSARIGQLKRAIGRKNAIIRQKRWRLRVAVGVFAVACLILVTIAVLK